MPTAVIGALRVDLDLGTAGWKSGLNSAQKDAAGAKAKFESVGKGIATAGAALTVGVTAPFTALLRTAIPAATESAQAMGQVEAALKSMGPVAGRTKEQLADAATELMHLSTFDDDEILRKVTANLLTFGTVAGEQFDRAQKAAVDLSTRMGGDLQSSTLLVGKALNDPIKGMGALRKVGIQLSDQQKEQVKAFVASGNAAGAQGVILTELERQFGGSAKAMRDATPGAEMKNNWDDFTETVGGLALKVLPILTDMASNVLAVFNQLSPTTQAIAVGTVALLAALGPIAGGVGLLVSGFGALIPILIGTAAAETATAAGLTAVEAAAVPLLATMLPIIAAVAGAAALAYAAWQHWDEIAPILQGVWDTVQATFGPPLLALFDAVKATLTDLWEGPFGALLREVAARAVEQFGAIMGKFQELGDLVGTIGAAVGNVLGPVLAAVFRGFVQYVSSTFEVVGKVLNAAAALVQGDFSGAWSYMKQAVTSAIGGVGKIIEAMVPGALSSLKALVDGARTWIVDKLGQVMDLALAPIRKVKDAFFGLYDAVVGHSYVPDMVDGIEAQMRRLDGVMVEPANKATKKVKDQFQGMRDDLKGLLDELFPEIRDSIDQANKLDLIERARKAGVANGGLSDDQAKAARARVFKASGSDAGMTPEETLDAWSKIELVPDSANKVSTALDHLKMTLPDLSKTAKKTTAETVEAFAGMAKDVLGSVRGMVSAFKGGDILGGITGLLDIVQQVSGLVRGNSTPRTTVNTVPLGGGRALGGPVVPGKRYRVGEKGPEWLEVNQPGRIVPNNDNGAGGGNVYHISGNLLTPEFWAQIQAGHDDAALRGAHGGAQLAMDRSAQRRQRSLYG